MKFAHAYAFPIVLFINTVFPPNVYGSSLDVVFMIDESHSMKGYQQAVRDNIPVIFQELATQTSNDFRAGIVGFGSSDTGSNGQHGMPVLRCSLTNDQEKFTTAANNLKDDGGDEFGLRAIIETEANNVNGQPLAGNLNKFCAILFSDEDSDIPSGSDVATERTNAANALSNSALISVVNCDSTYCTGTTQQDYVDISDSTYSISTFEGSTATFIIEDALKLCVEKVIDIKQSKKSSKKSSKKTSKSKKQTQKKRDNGQLRH